MSFKRREGARFRGKGPNGRNLCFCGCGKEVSPPRKNWFTEQCVTEWLIINSPGHTRKAVFERDRGICSVCGLDTVREKSIAAQTRRLWMWFVEKELKPIEPVELRRVRRSELMRQIDHEKKLRGWHKDHFWEADHIVAVIEGGGQCGLDGYRTLCTRCHIGVTSKLIRRIRSKPVTARQSLLPGLKIDPNED